MTNPNAKAWMTGVLAGGGVTDFTAGSVKWSKDASLQKAMMEGATPAGADVVLSGSNREPAGIGELLDDGQLNLELSNPTRSRARSSTFPVLYAPYWSGFSTG